MKSGFQIMDSDMHLREPADLWENTWNPEWRERAPKVLSSTARSSAMVMDPKGKFSAVSKGRDRTHFS